MQIENLLSSKKFCHLGVFVSSVNVDKFSVCEDKQGSSKATNQPKKEKFLQLCYNVKSMNRLCVAVYMFSNKSQMTIKCGKKKDIKFHNWCSYPIDANAMNSSTSNGKSSLKLVLKRAVTVSSEERGQSFSVFRCSRQKEVVSINSNLYVVAQNGHTFFFIKYS